MPAIMTDRRNTLAKDVVNKEVYELRVNGKDTQCVVFFDKTLTKNTTQSGIRLNTINHV